MSKITWADKVALDPQPGVAEENKVTPTNMNEIKYAINDIDDKKINSSGTNYIKFEDGTMICYGKSNGVNNSYRTVYFPIEFIDVPFFVATALSLDSNFQITAQYDNVTTSSVGVQIHYGPNQVGANNFTWIAIGKWK